MMTDFSPALAPEKARMLSPLQLAYIGDSVHALLVRTNLLQKNLLVRDMHRASNEAVSAVSGPKSASTADYAGATGLEALLGYLYVTGQSERLRELLPYIQGENTDHA